MPNSIRRLLAALIHYAQRLGRWVIILNQVRGASWRDHLKLVGSAAAAPVTALGDLSHWQDPVLLFDADVRVRGVGCFHVRRRSDDLWHVLPWREQDIHHALEQILGPGDIFVDAGANIGVYTLLASRLVGPTGRVIAIEMMPDTAAILRRHVRENNCGNVEIVEKALSDRADVKVTARVQPGKYGQASIAASAAGWTGQEEREVSTATLDQICDGIERIRLVKLDLEGAELQALVGANATLKRTDYVIYESHTSSGTLAELLKGAGFDVSISLGKDRLVQRRTEPAA